MITHSCCLNEKEKKHHRNKTQRENTEQFNQTKKPFISLIVINIFYIGIFYGHRRALSTFLAHDSWLYRDRKDSPPLGRLAWTGDSGTFTRQFPHLGNTSQGIIFAYMSWRAQGHAGSWALLRWPWPSQSWRVEPGSRTPGTAVRAGCSTWAPSQTVPLWVIELAQPQCPQEYCQCFPACLEPKYFQFTQNINRHCCRRTPVQLYIWHLAQLEVYTTEQIFLQRWVFKSEQSNIHCTLITFFQNICSDTNTQKAEQIARI